MSNNIPQMAWFASELTFWGVPADPSHDAMRGLLCETIHELNAVAVRGRQGGVHAGIAPVPFLTMPTGCSAGPETATARADSWQEPGSVRVNGRYSELPGSDRDAAGRDGL